MNNRVVFALFQAFQKRGYSVLRFNFRGVGRSQGRFDSGPGELSDAASALDWMQSVNPNASGCWIGGYSFGAWIGMQLLMRRPEIDGFIAVVAARGLPGLHVSRSVPGVRADPARRAGTTSCRPKPRRSWRKSSPIRRA